MSQKRMAVSLIVLELQRQKWTGGGILPPAAGIRVNPVCHRMLYSCTHMSTLDVKEL